MGWMWLDVVVEVGGVGRDRLGVDAVGSRSCSSFLTIQYMKNAAALLSSHHVSAKQCKDISGTASLFTSTCVAAW